MTNKTKVNILKILVFANLAADVALLTVCIFKNR